ncbi:MAG: hypothetical protein COB73_01025 [Flavobacteriaceae bacterium]|nr:MAG: hypothetical protein COB73_01025 [Flavobacteriaceae bacterium]
MKLTQKQIQFIENYLIEQGVKYWDVRIELIDHIVSEIECKKDLSLDFKKEVINISNNLGYNSYSVRKRLNEKTKSIRKHYNKLIITNAKRLFTSLKSVILIVFILCIYTSLYVYFSATLFVKLGIAIYLISFILVSMSVTPQLIKRKRSIYLDNACSIIISPFLIFNGFFVLVNNIEAKSIALLFVLPIYLLFTYCCWLVYRETYIKTQRIHKELNSI